MPCATGKSLTAFWIAQALDAKSIVVAVPSLALIRQSLLGLDAGVPCARRGSAMARGL